MFGLFFASRLLAFVLREEGVQKPLRPRRRELVGGETQETGGCPIFPFTGEISYRCFTGCQTYFGGPVKSPYEVSPVKVYLVYLSPPEATSPGRSPSWKSTRTLDAASSREPWAKRPLEIRRRGIANFAAHRGNFIPLFCRASELFLGRP